MKRTRKLAVILTVLMILSVFPMGVFAEEESKKMPTASFDEKVTLNDAGEVMPIRRAVLNLEDEDGPYTVTRVRLRDVAFALSSTEAKFDISFDEKQNAIIITTGVPYEQSEYDKREIDLKDANIIDSPHKVLVDGVEAKLDAFLNLGIEVYVSPSIL